MVDETEIRKSLYEQGLIAGYFRSQEQKGRHTAEISEKGVYDTRDHRSVSDLPEYNIIVTSQGTRVYCASVEPLLLPFDEGFYRSFLFPSEKELTL